MCSRSAQGRVLFTAVLLLGMSAGAADKMRISPSEWDEQQLLLNPIDDPPGHDSLPAATSRPSPGLPDESQIIRDPLPPAVWSGGSMFAIGGALAAWRRFRRGLR
jgi:hypothetical protein